VLRVTFISADFKGALDATALREIGFSGGSVGRGAPTVILTHSSLRFWVPFRQKHTRMRFLAELHPLGM